MEQEDENLLFVDIIEMEKQVLASAKAQVDYNHVVQVLSPLSSSSSSSSYLPEKSKKQSPPPPLSSSTLPLAPTSSSSWQIALAAATSTSFITYTFVTKNNVWMTVFCFIIVFGVALIDPIDDDSILWLLGPLARLWGRQTLQSYKETIQPKAIAVARAVVTDNQEWIALQQRIVYLEQENADLMQWKQIRLQAEENLSNYTLAQVKEWNQNHGLPVGGLGKRTKLQLLTQVLEYEQGMIEQARVE